MRCSQMLKADPSNTLVHYVTTAAGGILQYQTDFNFILHITIFRPRPVFICDSTGLCS